MKALVVGGTGPTGPYIIEGLQKRKSDLLDRIDSELNLTENNILENSNLNGIEELPNAVDQELSLIHI